MFHGGHNTVESQAVRRTAGFRFTGIYLSHTSIPDEMFYTEPASSVFSFFTLWVFNEKSLKSLIDFVRFCFGGFFFFWQLQRFLITSTFNIFRILFLSDMIHLFFCSPRIQSTLMWRDKVVSCSWITRI